MASIKNTLTNSLWVERYRPTNMKDYICNSEIMELFTRYIEKQEIDNLILYGKPGTGKDSAISVLLNNIDCDVLRINASDENSIDVIRTKIKSFISSVGFKKWKIVVLAEATHIAPAAQSVLLDYLELYSKSVRFIFTTNFIDRLLPAVRSRCTTLDIYPPHAKDIAKKLVAILAAEDVKFKVEDVAALVKSTYPDIRKTIRTAQQLSMSGELVLAAKISADADYMSMIVLELANGSTPAKTKYSRIRQIIANNAVRSFDSLYSYLFEHAEEFAREGGYASIILQIADYMYRDASVVDKELNVMAMIINIIKDVKNA